MRAINYHLLHVLFLIGSLHSWSQGNMANFQISLHLVPVLFILAGMDNYMIAGMNNYTGPAILGLISLSSSNIHLLLSVAISTTFPHFSKEFNNIASQKIVNCHRWIFQNNFSYYLICALTLIVEFRELVSLCMVNSRDLTFCFSVFYLVFLSHILTVDRDYLKSSYITIPIIFLTFFLRFIDLFEVLLFLALLDKDIVEHVQEGIDFSKYLYNNYLPISKTFLRIIRSRIHSTPDSMPKLINSKFYLTLRKLDREFNIRISEVQGTYDIIFLEGDIRGEVSWSEVKLKSIQVTDIFHLMGRTLYVPFHIDSKEHKDGISVVIRVSDTDRGIAYSHVNDRLWHLENIIEYFDATIASEEKSQPLAEAYD